MKVKSWRQCDVQISCPVLNWVMFTMNYSAHSEHNTYLNELTLDLLKDQRRGSAGLSSGHAALHWVRYQTSVSPSYTVSLFLCSQLRAERVACSV